MRKVLSINMLKTVAYYILTLKINYDKPNLLEFSFLKSFYVNQILYSILV